MQPTTVIIQQTAPVRQPVVRQSVSMIGRLSASFDYLKLLRELKQQKTGITMIGRLSASFNYLKLLRELKQQKTGITMIGRLSASFNYLKLLRELKQQQKRELILYN